MGSTRIDTDELTRIAQMFSILNEIQDNSPARTTGVVTASIGTSGSIYILVAITGYLTFGDNVVGNIVSQCKLSCNIDGDTEADM